MHPEIKQDKPGRCPECGMNLIPSPSPLPKGEREGVGHDKHEGHSLAMFARKFWVSLVLTIPVVLYSELPQKLFDWKAPVFSGSPYLSFIFGSIVFFYGGWVFLAGAWRELRARLPGMMTLIGIAITAAYLFSVFETLRGSPHTLFWELTTLITIMLLGHYLEMRAVQGAQGALKELAKLLPDTAELIINPSPTLPSQGEGVKTRNVPLAELKTGDMILVRPGGKIAADGKVVDGQSEVNESLVTGESKPVKKQIGNEVIAGTINGDGSLKIQVTKIGEKTFLAGVMRLVAEAQASKSKLQILSDRAAFYLTLVALGTGSITFVAWLLAKAGVIFATERLVAVLVIACPHALGLAVPLVASISTTMAARNGLLVKQRLALEAARTIGVVLFDKTGTLTKGEYGVDEVMLNPKSKLQITNDRVLQLAASVDAPSEHFVAKALVEETKKQGLSLLEVKDFQRVPGKGVRGVVEGLEILVGGEAILEAAQHNASSPPLTLRGGKTIIYVIAEGELLGAIALADIIREESREAINSLKKMGLEVAMITGDSEEVAAWVASELGIDEYFARVLPEQKADKVKVLQNRGLKVAMVGDGVNDAPALTQADLGIAIGAGTNVAIESAGIILVRNDPRDIVKIIKLSEMTYSKMIQNLFWATGYNVVALPLAAGVLAFKGILLQPALAALFMSLSTIIVAFNAILLRKKNLS